MSLCSTQVGLSPCGGLSRPGCSPSQILELSLVSPELFSSDLESPFIGKFIESTVWQWLCYYFAVWRDCTGSSLAGLSSSETAPALCCQQHWCGFLSTVLQGNCSVPLLLQSPYPLFLELLIGIPCPWELSLEADSSPCALRGRQEEGLMIWGIAADVLSQNYLIWCLLTCLRSLGLGSRMFSGPSGWFGCWKGLFVPHGATVYLAGASCCGRAQSPGSLLKIAGDPHALGPQRQKLVG